MWGEGKRKILIVGEAPGYEEDVKNVPFVGKTGQRLRRELKDLGIDLERDCWVTNALVCRPVPPRDEFGNEKGNTPPTDAQVDHCRPNVLKVVEDTNPVVVIPLGSHAVRSVIGYLWRENCGGVERWSGWRVPCQKWNCWVCPTYHPSFVEREDEKSPLASNIFRGHLERALSFAKRPWKQVPDYPSRCRFVYDPQEAGDVIREMTKAKTPVAFDYETNALKPDYALTRIVCCSVSDGKQSVGFIWGGDAVKAMKEFLASDCPKIASNLKFETRWSLAHVGVNPRNWLWDTMLAGHVLDNRREVTSIKFLGFALLGQVPWDETVSLFLKPKPEDQKKYGANALNQIHKTDMMALLRYCAMDSLMEWLVARKQMKMLGFTEQL